WTYPDPRKPSVLTSGLVYSSATLPALTSRVWGTTSGQGVISGTLYGQAVISGWTPAYTVETGPQPPLPQGYCQYEPELGWTPLAGRLVVAQLLSTARADWTWYDRLGGVFTFDQERTGLGRTISRQVWNVIHGTTARENEELRTTDPRTILIDL